MVNLAPLSCGPDECKQALAPQGAEELPDIGDHQFRLFPEGKVASVRQSRVVDQLRSRRRRRIWLVISLSAAVPKVIETCGSFDCATPSGSETPAHFPPDREYKPVTYEVADARTEIRPSTRERPIN
jgi:hypothetical protein